MPEKDPNLISQLPEYISFVWVWFLSLFGGAVGYYRRVNEGHIQHSMFRFFGEIMTSGFVGIITFELCDYATLDWHLTAAMVGIGGHMGARAIFRLESVYKSLIGGKK